MYAAQEKFMKNELHLTSQRQYLYDSLLMKSSTKDKYRARVVTDPATGKRTVYINLAVLNGFHKNYQIKDDIPSGLIQLWQMEKCAELVQQEEKRIGSHFHYKRVARIRTDVVFKDVDSKGKTNSNDKPKPASTFSSWLGFGSSEGDGDFDSKGEMKQCEERMRHGDPVLIQGADFFTAVPRYMLSVFAGLQRWTGGVGLKGGKMADWNGSSGVGELVTALYAQDLKREGVREPDACGLGFGLVRKTPCITTQILTEFAIAIH